MWHRAMISKFLKDQKASPEAIQVIEKRLDGLVSGEGMFSAASLNIALQDETLEASFVEAWNADPIPFLEAKNRAQAEPPPSEVIDGMCET